MKNYEVSITAIEKQCGAIVVRAKNEEEAKEKAIEAYFLGDVMMYYADTVDLEEIEIEETEEEADI